MHGMFFKGSCIQGSLRLYALFISLYLLCAASVIHRMDASEGKNNLENGGS